MVTLTATLAVGAAGYLVCVLCSYLFSFSAYEAVRLASFSRYVGTYLLGATLALVMLAGHALLNRWESGGKKTVQWLAGFLAVLILCVPPELFINFVPVLYPHSLSQEYASYSSKVLQATPEDASVLVVSQSSTNLDDVVMNYIGLPRRTMTYSLGSPKAEGDAWTKELDREQFMSLAQEFDYVFIYKLDDDFVARYGECFGSDVQQGTLYTFNGAALQPLETAQ